MCNNNMKNVISREFKICKHINESNPYPKYAISIDTRPLKIVEKNVSFAFNANCFFLTKNITDTDCMGINKIITDSRNKIELPFSPE